MEIGVVKMRIRFLTIVAASLAMSGCTSANTAKTLQVDAGQFLTADEIRSQIIGNTMVGTATGITGIRYPYKIYLSDGLYLDRIVVQGTPRNTKGRYEVMDDGRICTWVRAYRSYYARSLWPHLK